MSHFMDYRTPGPIIVHSVAERNIHCPLIILDKLKELPSMVLFHGPVKYTGQVGTWQCGDLFAL